jgi:hypothetical protein
MPTFRNVSPYGDLEIPLRASAGVPDRLVVVPHGDVIDVNDVTAAGMVEQVTLWESVTEVNIEGTV